MLVRTLNLHRDKKTQARTGETWKILYGVCSIPGSMYSLERINTAVHLCTGVLLELRDNTAATTDVLVETEFP